MAKKLLLLVVFAAAVFGYFYFGLNNYLTLDAFKARQADFAMQYAANPALFLGAFFVLYVAVTALSVPGAAILTMAAGALFGLLTGTILVSFASSIGATLAFLSSRYVLRDWVQEKFGSRLEAINDGFERDGAFYLFTLRMIPAFPFFMVNLLMGLTKIRTVTYYWVSQLGMLAGTLVFVNAGTELARIQSTSGLLTPALLGSFLALAIFPWIAKAVIGWLNARKIYKGYKRPKSFDRNLIVIGAGSAGLVASYIAAMVKAKVTLIEAHAMGGDCLNTGCVPSKALIKSAGRAFDVADAGRFGIVTDSLKVDFPAVTARVLDVIKAIEPHDSVERFTGLGVECVSGYAKFLDPWTVEITSATGDQQRLTARDFILATGAAPYIPDLPGLKETAYLTSENLWNAMAKRKAVPKRLLILGGGPIGCELAQAFQRLGSRVTLVEMADALLAKEDVDAGALIAQRLTDEGVQLLLGHKAVRIENGKKLITSSIDGVTALPFDDIIIAVGRRARVSGFGLEELGLVVDGKLANDDYLSTPMPHIRVAGDVAGRQQLTHGASHEAWYAAVNALARPFKSYRADYRVLPRVTYTAPEVAHVGLTESEAAAQNIAFDITRYDLDDLDRAIAESEAYGFVKILTAKGSDRILGATIVGQHAGETIAELVLAMRHNLGLGKVMATIHSYPTWAEANKYAAGQYRLARKPESLLIWAERWFRWRRGGSS
jgi:pyruvate/2-oxoglutarate dehydrogenase complex dihydrolipoamide dehydrogenase (E3) component/uncharacterized membrane protein YdjX (TVP38/TMEM64 family)